MGEEWPIEGRTPRCCNQLTADLAVHIAGPAIELLDEAQVRWLLRGTHHPHGHLGPRLDTGDAVRHDLWCRASEVAGGGGDRSIDVMESVDRGRDHESRDQLVDSQIGEVWGRGGREDKTYLYVLCRGHPRRRRRRRSVCSCVGVSCSGCVPSRPSDRKGSGHQALSRGLLLTQVCESPQKVNSCEIFCLSTGNSIPFLETRRRIRLELRCDDDDVMITGRSPGSAAASPVAS